MRKIHSIHAAKTHLSRLVERACAGEEVVIARGKTPVVKLVRTGSTAPRRQSGAMLPIITNDEVFDGYGVTRLW
jgi:antitoxin (DNA-binding transcriptional repressor) of toxin-antitoxin stability system